MIESLQLENLKMVRFSSHRRKDSSQWGQSIASPYDTLLEAAKLVREGLTFSAIGTLQRASGLTLERIKQVTRMSEGSFNRRKKTGRLSPDESERLLRLSRVFERALELHAGDAEETRRWLSTPIPSLNNHRPLDLLETEPGAREVEDLLGRIAHGVIS
jgi:putative toxin-antitoxin system antitoxin component (TIGR02293 family)